MIIKKIPAIIIKDKRKYYIVKIYKKGEYVRYQTARGVCECFKFSEL